MHGGPGVPLRVEGRARNVQGSLRPHKAAASRVALLAMCLAGCGEADRAPGGAASAAGGPAARTSSPDDIPHAAARGGGEEGHRSEGPSRYHERSWDAVRARASSHLAAQGRDRARARAMVGDYGGCAARYGATADALAGLPIQESVSRRIRDSYERALRRDAALCGALARGEAPPVSADATAEPVATLYALAARARIGAPVPSLALPQVRPLHLSAMDPAARHELRATLTEAWSDTVDPLAPTDPWGYWTPEEGLRAYRRLVGEPHAAVPFHPTHETLAEPPTGDTYVDSAGLPGPRAMSGGPAGAAGPSSLEQDLAASLQATGTTGAVAALRHGLPRLEASPDGPRRARGVEAAVLRALARAGAYAEAATIARGWRVERPFEHASINRQGVVRGIEGRLLLLAGDPRAEEVLGEAEDATRAFLDALPR